MSSSPKGRPAEHL